MLSFTAFSSADICRTGSSWNGILDGILVGNRSGRLCSNGVFADCDQCSSSYGGDEGHNIELCGRNDSAAAWSFDHNSIMGNTGLDKRIAITFLRLIGNSLRMQLVFWFALSMVLSAVLPNAVVCATITPIAVSMLKYIGMDDVKTARRHRRSC